MPNFRSAGAEIFDSEKRIGRKENRAAGAKKRPSVTAGLIFLTSYSALSRISRDPRVKPEDDKEEKKVLEDGRREKSPRMTIIYLSFPCFFSFLSFPCFFSFSSFPGSTGESLDCRIKSGNDRGGESLTRESVREMSGSRPNMTGEKRVRG